MTTGVSLSPMENVKIRGEGLLEEFVGKSVVPDFCVEMIYVRARSRLVWRMLCGIRGWKLLVGSFVRASSMSKSREGFSVDL